MSLLTTENPFRANRLNEAADFRPEWDCPSFGQQITTALNQDIDALRERPLPDPRRKVHLIVGAPGYGKTHLFGRVRNEQQERIQFVFVPQPADPSRPVEYVCWSVVESLFEANGNAHSPLHRLFGRLLCPSFSAYFEQLPAGLRAKFFGLNRRLANDPYASLDILTAVRQLGPYHSLAESFQTVFPGLRADVLRGLVLGLSPAAESARKWLRGEAGQLPEGLAQSLKLGTSSPPPVEVLRTLGVLFAKIDVPLVLSLDQLDQLLLANAVGFQELASQLMKWLQEVPNFLVVLAAVDSTWKVVQTTGNLAAFVDRVSAHNLKPLTGQQACELVVRRMLSCPEVGNGRAKGYPFDLASVGEFVQKQPVSPRALIDLCSGELDNWLVDRPDKLIDLHPTRKIELKVLFRQEWDAQLDKCRQSMKDPVNYKDEELWDCVKAALDVARLGEFVPAGVKFEGMQDQALPRATNDPRYSAELRLAAGLRRVPVVAAVSKTLSGRGFTGWMNDLGTAVSGNVAGAVVVWPSANVQIGRTSQGYRKYQELQQSGKLRTFPLDEHSDSFASLLCLRQLIRDAINKNLLLDGKTIDELSCRQLVVDTKVLENLKLFEFLFQNWPELEKARLTVIPTAKTVPDSPQPRSVPTAAATDSKPVAVVKLLLPPPPPPSPAWADQLLTKVVEMLRRRGQPVRPIGHEVGPTFVRLKVEPKDETDFAKVKKQIDNLKMQLGVEQRPFIAAQAGYISIDVQRKDRQTVSLASLLPSRPVELAGQPAFPVGVDVAGRPHWLNLADTATCHLLLAGTTGSGKSQFLKAMLAALADHLEPDKLQFVLIDPKRVTFMLQGESPYLHSPVVFDAEEALPVLERCFEEMERRYALLESLGKEDVKELTGADMVPRWIVVFDEFADLMADRASKKDLEALLRRLGAKARAAGIHLVLGTQRPEASVVTPLLRSNLPGRIALQVTSERDSRIILDEPDAAHLLDKGDLFWRRGGALQRLQSPLVSKAELESYLRLH